MKRTTPPQARQDTRALLQAHGLRFSKPRAVILEFFSERASHISADALHLALRARGEAISLSTVYLNLGVLKQAGLIRELRGSSGEALYDSSVHPHYHLVCRHCGSVQDLPGEVLGELVAERIKTSAEAASGWRVEQPTLDLQGCCPDCQRRQADPQTSTSL